MKGRPKRAIIRSGELLYKQSPDSDLLQVLSCIDIKLAEEINDIRKELIEKTKDNALSWNGQFVQSGFDDGKIGIAIAYSKLHSVAVLNYDKLKDPLTEVAKEYGIETIYAMIFHSDNFDEIRKVK